MQETRVVTIRGMPDGWKRKMERWRAQGGLSKSAAYTAAFDLLSARMEGGARVLDFPPASRSKPYPVKMPKVAVDRADRAIKANGPPLKKSRFTREAVRLYLDIQATAPPD